MARKLLIVDDHRLSLEGTKGALQRDGGLQVVGVALSAAEALAALKRLEVDVVLIDLQLPDTDAAACIGLIRRNHPQVAVIGLCADVDRELVDRALSAGALGCIRTSIDPASLGVAIHQIVERTIFTSVSVSPQDEAEPIAAADLTVRERTMLLAVARGLSNRAISKELWVTEQTVKFHLNNVYRKLGVANRTAAARFAYQHGLLEQAGA